MNIRKYIDSDGVLTDETPQFPARSGFYYVIFTNGKTGYEPYSVAMGWNNYPSWLILCSSFACYFDGSLSS